MGCFIINLTVDYCRSLNYKERGVYRSSSLIDGPQPGKTRARLLTNGEMSHCYITLLATLTQGV